MAAGLCPSLRCGGVAVEESGTMLDFPCVPRALRITESQPGRGWQGPLWITQPNPLLKQGHPEQAAQHRGQGGLEYLQRRRLHSPSGQPRVCTPVEQGPGPSVGLRREPRIWLDFGTLLGPRRVPAGARRRPGCGWEQRCSLEPLRL